ncbi:spore germination protein [Marinicrinis sediminis]|uniref:Spore germination protein n=1 Tax=Marinicrinis sediminis TaxID=1652465 RepID=A0ABW5R9E0_9BACL
MKIFLNRNRSSNEKQTQASRTQTKHAGASAPSGHTYPEFLHSSLAENIAVLKQQLGKSDDLVVRYLSVYTEKDEEIPAALAYVDGLTDQMMIEHSVMFPLQELVKQDHPIPLQAPMSYIQNHVLLSTNVKQVDTFKSLFYSLFSGNVILFLHDQPLALSTCVTAGDNRTVEEPSSETVIRGPKDSFTETLRTNTSLIRRRIKDERLHSETFILGRVTHTEVSIMYIHGIASEQIIAEVRSRIEKIDIDGILESMYVEEFIEEKTMTPFPTVFHTERPDVVSANLLEGRIAIFVQGTPFVLIVPTLFIQFFHAAEDYYQRADMAILIRLLRYFAFFISLLAPSLYIAITTFHQEMLPTPLLISLASQREGIPFPAFIEAIMMEVTFEIIREAGVRMPRAVGQTVSIVGALVIGQAAVEAGVVSAVMVIVVAITAIASFVSPNYNLAIAVRILRFAFIFLAASFGLYGITLGLIGMIIHLCSLKSFTIPYMAPMAPFNLEEQKDGMLRLPWPKLNKRPTSLRVHNENRQPPPPSRANARKKRAIFNILRGKKS